MIRPCRAVSPTGAGLDEDREPAEESGQSVALSRKGCPARGQRSKPRPVCFVARSRSLLEGLSYSVEPTLALTLRSLALCLWTPASQREVNSLGHLLHLPAPSRRRARRGEREARASDTETNRTPRGCSAWFLELFQGAEWARPLGASSFGGTRCRGMQSSAFVRLAAEVERLAREIQVRSGRFVSVRRFDLASLPCPHGARGRSMEGGRKPRSADSPPQGEGMLPSSQRPPRPPGRVLLQRPVAYYMSIAIL